MVMIRNHRFHDSHRRREAPCSPRGARGRDDRARVTSSRKADDVLGGRFRPDLRAELRMNAYATSGGVSKQKFEAFALAASIVGKCHFCVKSHYELLKKEGLTTQQLRDIGRIAAVVNAAAQVLAAE